jgi:hypothetical protein
VTFSTFSIGCGTQWPLYIIKDWGMLGSALISGDVRFRLVKYPEKNGSQYT